MTTHLAAVPALLASLGQTAVNLALEVVMGWIVSNSVPVAQGSVTQ